MSQRVSIFLVVLLLMFNGEILGQPKSSFSIPFSGRVTIKKTPNLFKPTFSLPQVLKYEDSTGFNKYSLLNVPTASFYINSLGFICQKELQLDKITPVPIRLRLGSLEYVNWMEQKPNVNKPYR